MLTLTEESKDFNLLKTTSTTLKTSKILKTNLLTLSLSILQVLSIEHTISLLSLHKRYAVPQVRFSTSAICSI